MAGNISVTPGKIFASLSFAAMVTVNALANILPINGIGTGAVSDSYPNLFAPAGITFAIWGLIYLLLLFYSVYQFGAFAAKDGQGLNAAGTLIKRISTLFTISSLANAVWIFSWHYAIIGLSLLLMIVILICLILIIENINKADLSLNDKALIRLPFSVYFGWITVAAIANATTLLVDIGWDGFGVAENIWTAVIISVGLLIAAATMIKHRDIAYGLVIVWAYAGILIKHLSGTGFAGKYPEIIVTVIVCIALLVVASVYILLANTKKNTAK